ncbi:MAG: 30S ribosomal protein S5 [Candidatus Niyogibacteria bacterium]|nr:30S ribosomal protein S5 [Candidatus Niyogibacteria bacterium]
MAEKNIFKKRERKDSEFDQKLIDLRRVARVVAGGRRFSFRSTMVIGDRLGKVGVGTAKGVDTATAIQKAVRLAGKKAIKINLTKNMSIAHDVRGKFASAKVIIRPAVEGHGLVAGSSVRMVLDLAGVKNASAKILSHTKNKISNARAAMEALKKLK